MRSGPSVEARGECGEQFGQRGEISVMGGHVPGGIPRLLDRDTVRRVGWQEQRRDGTKHCPASLPCTCDVSDGTTTS